MRFYRFFTSNNSRFSLAFRPPEIALRLRPTFVNVEVGCLEGLRLQEPSIHQVSLVFDTRFISEATKIYPLYGCGKSRGPDENAKIREFRDQF